MKLVELTIAQTDNKLIGQTREWKMWFNTDMIYRVYDENGKTMLQTKDQIGTQHCWEVKETVETIVSQVNGENFIRRH